MGHLDTWVAKSGQNVEGIMESKDIHVYPIFDKLW
jgi:hypothetical protein